MEFSISFKLTQSVDVGHSEIRWIAEVMSANTDKMLGLEIDQSINLRERSNPDNIIGSIMRTA